MENPKPKTPIAPPPPLAEWCDRAVSSMEDVLLTLADITVRLNTQLGRSSDTYTAAVTLKAVGDLAHATTTNICQLWVYLEQLRGLVDTPDDTRRLSARIYAQGERYLSRVTDERLEAYNAMVTVHNRMLEDARNGRKGGTA
jgi:hypothetical protein